MSKILFDESPLVIDTTLAIAIGLNEAIIVQQVHYWLEINKKSGNNFIDGRHWTYNSISKWHKEHFPFLAEKTVKRTFSNLVEMGILVTGNYNKQKMDRTLWYSIDYSELEKKVDNFRENALGQNGPMHGDNMTQCKGTKSTNGLGQNDPMQRDNLTPPIPETSTETNSEINTETSSSSLSDEMNDQDFQEVINSFNNNIHLITPIEAQKLNSYLEDVDKDIILYAIESSVMYSARNMGYISKVINNLIAAGVTSKVQLDAYIRDHEDKKRKQQDIKRGSDSVHKNDEYRVQIDNYLETTRKAREQEAAYLKEKYKDWKPSDHEEFSEGVI